MSSQNKHRPSIIIDENQWHGEKLDWAVKTAFTTRNFLQLNSSRFLPNFEKVLVMVGYGELVY